MLINARPLLALYQHCSTIVLNALQNTVVQPLLFIYCSDFFLLHSSGATSVRPPALAESWKKVTTDLNKGTPCRYSGARDKINGSEKNSKTYFFSKAKQ
jgi:hypothetical protein